MGSHCGQGGRHRRVRGDNCTARHRAERTRRLRRRRAADRGVFPDRHRAAGVVRAYLATQIPAGEPRGLVFLAAAVTILLGLIIVTHWPLDSVYVLGTLLGVDLLFHGVGWVSFGMGLHSRA